MRWWMIGVVGLALAGTMAGPSRADVTVVAPHSLIAGKTIGQWTGDWWNWALGTSVVATGQDALSDLTGAYANNGQSGPVFFLSGMTATRYFNLPGDKYVLFPLLNWVGIDGLDDSTWTSMQEEVTTLATNTINPANLFATVDGVTIPDLASHRETTGGYFLMKPAEGNAFGWPTSLPPDWPDGFANGYADGYWVMLEPLGAGPHTLHFGGTSTAYQSPGYLQHLADPLNPALYGMNVESFSQIVTDHSPVPEPSTLAVLGIGAIGLLACGWRRRKRTA